MKLRSCVSSELRKTVLRPVLKPTPELPAGGPLDEVTAAVEKINTLVTLWKWRLLWQIATLEHITYPGSSREAN